jgi:hypothetical protein
MTHDPVSASDRHQTNPLTVRWPAGRLGFTNFCIGQVQIESGLLLLADPVHIPGYAVVNESGELSGEAAGDMDYFGEEDTLCAPALADPEVDDVEDYRGVMTRTGIGDGVYDVLAQIENGRVIGISIDFKTDESLANDEVWCIHPNDDGFTLRTLPHGPAWLCSGCCIRWDEDGEWPVTQASQPPWPSG